jgi:hypothetical protein
VRDRGPFRLTVRHGPKVTKARFASLDEAVAALERDLDAIVPGARRRQIDLKVRQFDPAQQIVARGEISGPGGARGGVDVRGDASSEAYVGRLTRRALEPAAGETAFDALRRALAG